MNSVLVFARLLAAAAAVAGLASCMPYDPPLRIALIRWPPFEYLHLAQEKGFFEQEGVEVRLIEFVAASDTQRAFEHDKIDGGTLTMIEVLQNRDLLTRQLQIPLVIDFSDGADVVMAAQEIADIRGLRGRRVGVTSSPLDLYLLARALELHGLALQDVSLVYMRNTQLLDALRSGKVDAVTSYPPNSVAIEEAGVARPIFTSKAIPGEIVDVLAVDETVVRERPEDIARLIRAFYRAVRYAEQNPDDAMQIMAERQRITADSFRKSLQTGITMVSLPDQLGFLGERSSLPEVARRISRLMQEQGQLSKADYDSDLLNGHPATLALSP